MKKRLTLSEFVQQAQKIHNNKYDYLEIIYDNVRRAIAKIKCSTHGIYEQRVDCHLSGQGCLKCRIENKRLSVIDFIRKAKIIHGDKFDYSKVNYISAHMKVEIFCREHGSFFQIPSSHLRGCGCPFCAGKQKTIEDFIEQTKNIHSGKYDYSKSKYITTQTKLEIICSKHGSFWQTPNNHLRGKGCPHCSHRVSKAETKWLNEQNILEEYRQYKIGINNRWFKVDGYDSKTNTVYEFLGDYWHGNPKQYKPDEVNKLAHKSFGQLYQKTMNRIELFRKYGYNVEYIWESDYLKS